MHSSLVCLALVLILAALPIAAGALEKDVVATSVGDLEISFVGHGSLVLSVGGTVIHVDPFGKLADYSTLPKAHLVLITHDHSDHLDRDALAAIRTDSTRVIVAPACGDRVAGAVTMANGEERKEVDILITAVPAYNLVHARPDGSPFHPKGQGNGYVLTIGDTRVYIAGDTENTPEMKTLGKIDVAFLPMNLPYTMTPEMVADAARAFRPKILYPYHYGDTDPQRLVEMLAGDTGIEVRVRSMR